MTYRIDPELAPFADMIPASDFSDPVAARAGLAALIAPLNAGVDTAGVDVEDRTVPGPRGRARRPRPHLPAGGAVDRSRSPRSSTSTAAGSSSGSIEMEHAGVRGHGP